MVWRWGIKSLVIVSSLFLSASFAGTSIGAPLKKDTGTIVTAPAASSTFSKVKVGMYSKQVTDLIGAPTDQKSYQTGKAFIPFHFGGDNYRTEYHYKGEGTLTFSGGGMGDVGSLKLIKINPDPSESGYIH